MKIGFSDFKKTITYLTKCFRTFARENYNIKMKNKFLLFLVLSLFAFSACNSGWEKQETTGRTIGQTGNEPMTNHWVGTYEGVIPCADCPGIKITLTLAADTTFSEKREYLEREQVLNYKGSFTWDEPGKTLTLQGDHETQKYKVENNQLLFLDKDGKRITGVLADHYALSRESGE